MMLCCDTYQHGEKTEDAVLIDHMFVKNPETANVFSTEQYKAEILSGYPRHDYFFIDCANRKTACTDEYYMIQKPFLEDGSLAEDLGASLTDMRIPGSYPSLDYLRSYRFHLADRIKASDGKILPEHVTAGEPVYLFLEGDLSGEEIPAAFHDRTMEEILADPEILERFEICNFIYCFFE